jgi:hypothetical protein
MGYEGFLLDMFIPTFALEPNHLVSILHLPPLSAVASTILFVDGPELFCFSMG